MSQNNPAEWAMAKAQEVQDAILSMNPITHSEYAAERILIIARAIEAADKAATERAAAEIEAMRDALNAALGFPASGPTFRQGASVRKKRGSSWRGYVCGWYSTATTPEGYPVESAFEPGSVQVWPVAALELWDDTTAIRKGGGTHE